MHIVCSVGRLFSSRCEIFVFRRVEVLKTIAERFAGFPQTSQERPGDLRDSRKRHRKR